MPLACVTCGATQVTHPKLGWHVHYTVQDRRHNPIAGPLLYCSRHVKDCDYCYHRKEPLIVERDRTGQIQWPLALPA